MGYAAPDILPPTDKQVAYARQIAQRLQAVIPPESAGDRRALSNWISSHREGLDRAFRAPGASSRQVAFAEQIARRKRLAVPDECFRDAGLMSRWIDRNR